MEGESEFETPTPLPLMDGDDNISPKGVQMPYTQVTLLQKDQVRVKNITKAVTR